MGASPGKSHTASAVLDTATLNSIGQDDLMKTLTATVAALATGDHGDLGKIDCTSIDVEMVGIVGDRHRSFFRSAWEGDKQPEGTERRNERQWSAISIEELSDIAAIMDLKEELTASVLGVNICFEGLTQLSRLPKGTILKFPSGAELIVEEYNPPCLDMGKKIARTFSTNSGEPLSDFAFSKAAQLTRGLVGVVEVEGRIEVGDEVTIIPHEHPKWLERDASDNVVEIRKAK